MFIRSDQIPNSEFKNPEFFYTKFASHFRYKINPEPIYEFLHIYKILFKTECTHFYDISGEHFAVVQKEKKNAAKIDTPEEVNESPMDSNDPPMTAASPTPEEDSQNFPKIQENRDFVDQARVSNRCGHVVRDFESEAKTRCNFQF
jgi:hypothetical protein